MASSLPAATAASVSKTTSASSLPFDQRHCSHSNVSFHLSSKPKLRIFAKGLRSNLNHSTVVKAQLNEVAVDGSSNAAPTPATNPEVPEQEEKDAKTLKESSSSALASEESISEFITQVSSLIKLVDSKDIVELQLKQPGCEVVIRKKEALPQPSSPATMVMMHSPSPSVTMPSAFPTAPPAAAPAPPVPESSAASAPSPLPHAATSHKASLKCPMAGTFYRSPGPGEPPFLKVGDKVQKGQVLCIVEAMKLMNEIEADQSGKIVEVLVDDGKPVSVDTPLFVIEP